MSSFSCNNCGKDFNKDPARERKIFKVRLGTRANMLCWSCKCKLEDEVEDIAMKYLGKR